MGPEPEPDQFSAALKLLTQLPAPDQELLLLFSALLRHTARASRPGCEVGCGERGACNWHMHVARQSMLMRSEVLTLRVQIAVSELLTLRMQISVLELFTLRMQIAVSELRTSRMQLAVLVLHVVLPLFWDP